MTRQSGYSYIRLICIVAMAVIHVLVWIDSPDDEELTRQVIPFETIQWIIGHLGFVPLGLVIVAGILFERFATFHEHQPFLVKLEGLGLKALFFFAAGCVLNAITWGSQYTFEWDVLHFIAISLVIALCLHRLGGNMLLAAVGLLCFPDWNINIGEHFVQSIVFGDPEGLTFYPLFPWFSWFVFGFFLSKLDLDRKQWGAIFGVGLVVSATLFDYGTFAVTSDNIWGNPLFDPDRLVLLVNLVKFLTFYSLLCLLPELATVRTFSKHVFAFYFIHVFIGYKLTEVFYDLGWVWVLAQIPIVIMLLLFIDGMSVVINRFIIRRFLSGRTSRSIDNDTRLIEEEYLDSLDIMNLLAFVSRTFGVNVALDELDEEKLRDVNAIAQLIRNKSADDA